MIKVIPICVVNNRVNLCDSCVYVFAECGATYKDMLFGDGKGHDNVCACACYTPIRTRKEANEGESSLL